MEGVRMRTEAPHSHDPFTPFEQLRFAREVLQNEGQAILTLADQLGDEFCRAVEVLSQCQGNVIVAGMGKAGLIGRKIAATLASTGTLRW